MQEKAGEQGAAYIPMPKGRGFTPHFDKVDYFFADREQVEREEQAEIKKWELAHGPLNF